MHNNYLTAIFGIYGLFDKSGMLFVVKKMVKMEKEKICKAIHQYSSEKVSREDMTRLLDIAHDCMAVRNYVYQRYGGIKSLGKLYPGYTIQIGITVKRIKAPSFNSFDVPNVMSFPFPFSS